jgi:pyruvate dehydrogenase E1 component beta subunit
MVAAGVGAALRGMHPIVDLNFIDFAFGAMDEIMNQAGKIPYMLDTPVPLLIRATSGIAHGAAQHNNSLESWFMHAPGLNVVVPGTPRDVKGLVKSALRTDEPVIFLMHKRLTGERGEIPDAEELVPLGLARIVRPGDGCTLISYGATLATVAKAAERLREEGVDSEIIDVRTLFPLDLETLVTSVRKTGRAVVVDDAPVFAGPSAEIAAAIQEAAFVYLDAPVRRVGSPRIPVPESTPLLEARLPSPSSVVEAVRGTFGLFGEEDRDGQ